MIGGLILYVRAPSLDHFVFENKNVKILFRFCRRHYFDLRIIVASYFYTSILVFLYKRFTFARINHTFTQ